MNLPKVEIYLESVILGAGKTNRGAGCAILLLCNSITQKDEEKYRKAITWYAGQGVNQAEIVKTTAGMVLDALSTSCNVTVFSSARQPSGFTATNHLMRWQQIADGSRGWQQRAHGAAWEIALAGEVTPAVCELAVMPPIAPALLVGEDKLQQAGRKAKALLDAAPLPFFGVKQCQSSGCSGNVQIESGKGNCDACGLRHVFIEVDPQYLDLVEDRKEEVKNVVSLAKHKRNRKATKGDIQLLYG